MKSRKVLLIYTGGTIGMIDDPNTGTLKPFDFSHITTEVPELLKFNCQIDTISFENPIDSSNMSPSIWKKLVTIIEHKYASYDGFVVLHGTDTMSYTASALSFMIQNLSKPIIFTGSQLPIGIIRTDGKENLVTAIEIASSYIDEQPIVPEVAIYFEYKLYRGNRSTKLSAHHFNAFETFNYPYLAVAGIDIEYNRNAILPVSDKTPIFNTNLNDNISVLKLFPGISEKSVAHFFEIPKLKGAIIETFGSGNATTQKWFLEILKKAIEGGIKIINVTQCKSGTVNQSKYQTGKELQKIGVISGSDLTIEAAITKLMFVIANNTNHRDFAATFQSSIAGEM